MATPGVGSQALCPAQTRDQHAAHLMTDSESLPTPRPNSLCAVVLLGLAYTVPLAYTTPLSAQEPQAESVVEDPLLDLDFPGGNLSEFAARLRQAVEDSRARYAATIRPVNIALPAIADQVMVPAMKLHDVTVLTAMATLEPLCAPAWNISQRKSVGPGSPIYSLRIESTRRSTTEVAIGTQVLSLRSLIVSPPRIAEDPTSRLSADTILTAIDAGIKLGGDEDRVKLAYHESSALLFVRGPAHESRLAAETIQTLKVDLEARRAQLREEAHGTGRQGPTASSGRTSRPNKEVPLTEGPSQRAPTERDHALSPPNPGSRQTCSL